MLMAARDRDHHTAMSEKELIDEVMTLIVAGHETTAAALTWTWYLISQHPETAAQLEAEADRSGAEYAAPRCRRVARLHPPGDPGGAAAVSAGVAVHAAHDRGRRARRLCHRRAHRRVHQPLYPASAPGSSGANRRNFAPDASPASMPRSGTDSPSFRFRSVRGTASARTWPCSRCWCTSIAWCAVFG